MKTAKILKQDFDAAVSEPWNPTTCIMAQAANRLGLAHNTEITMHNPRALDMRNRFDANYPIHGTPSALQKRNLAKIRASLPLTVKIPE